MRPRRKLFLSGMKRIDATVNESQEVSRQSLPRTESMKVQPPAVRIRMNSCRIPFILISCRIWV